MINSWENEKAIIKHLEEILTGEPIILGDIEVDKIYRWNGQKPPNNFFSIRFSYGKQEYTHKCYKDVFRVAVFSFFTNELLATRAIMELLERLRKPPNKEIDTNMTIKGTRLIGHVVEYSNDLYSMELNFKVF